MKEQRFPAYVVADHRATDIDAIIVVVVVFATSTGSSETGGITIMKRHSHRPKAANFDTLIAQPNAGLLLHKESPTICVSLWLTVFSPTLLDSTCPLWGPPDT